MKTKVFDSIKDTGDRTKFSTGSVRDRRAGKGRYDLVPPKALRRVAIHFENGAKKYGERNWEKGQPLCTYHDSAVRHLFDWLDGDKSEDHLAAAAWNVLCLIETEERIAADRLPKELDDQPLLYESNWAEVPLKSKKGSS